MIVRLINKENIWIPEPDIFLNIIDKTGLKLSTEYDKQKIINTLKEEIDKEHHAWFFNVKLSFNVKSSNGSVPCNVRILKDRKSEKYSGSIVFSTESDLVVFRDFDYEF